MYSISIATFPLFPEKEVDDAVAGLVEEQMVVEEAEKPVESAPEGTKCG